MVSNSSGVCLPLLVVCGPSGCGKSTLLDMLFKKYPNQFGFSVSHTTRQPREGEKAGQHYHFTTVEAMNDAINKGKFLESATYSGNIYGTSYQAVESVCQSNKVCVLDIDMAGVKQVKKQNGLDLILVFIKPPSKEILENRLRARGTESEESLKKRLSVVFEEIKFGEAGNFDIVIVNDNLETAFSLFEDFLVLELGKRNINMR